MGKFTSDYAQLETHAAVYSTVANTSAMLPTGAPRLYCRYAAGVVNTCYKLSHTCRSRTEDLGATVIISKRISEISDR